VRQQQLIARLQQCQIDADDRGQAAGHESAKFATFKRGDALFEREAGGRAMQSVGVAGFVFPISRAHGGQIGENHGGGFVHGDLRRYKAYRGLVGVVDQVGGFIFDHHSIVAKN
jgi:hypothetical protein